MNKKLMVIMLLLLAGISGIAFARGGGGGHGGGFGGGQGGGFGGGRGFRRRKKFWRRIWWP